MSKYKVGDRVVEEHNDPKEHTMTITEVLHDGYYNAICSCSFKHAIEIHEDETELVETRDWDD